MTCWFAVAGLDPEDPLGVVLEDQRAFGLIRNGSLDVGDGPGDEVGATFGVKRRIATEHDTVGPKKSTTHLTACSPPNIAVSVSGTVKFTTSGASDSATIARGHTVYATGAMIAIGDGRRQLLLKQLKPLRAELYTLTLRHRAHGGSSSRRETITIT